MVKLMLLLQSRDIGNLGLMDLPRSDSLAIGLVVYHNLLIY